MLKHLHLNKSFLFSYFRVNNRDYMQSLKSAWSVLHMSLQPFLFPVTGNSKGRRKNTQIYFWLIFVVFHCSDFANTHEKVLQTKLTLKILKNWNYNQKSDLKSNFLKELLCNEIAGSQTPTIVKMELIHMQIYRIFLTVSEHQF